jgi:hypothetical protein
VTFAIRLMSVTKRDISICLSRVVTLCHACHAQTLRVVLPLSVAVRAS